MEGASSMPLRLAKATRPIDPARHATAEAFYFFIESTKKYPFPCHARGHLWLDDWCYTRMS